MIMVVFSIYPFKYAESCNNKKVEKCVFHFVMNMGQRKSLQTSDLQISHCDALPLSHRDSTVSKVYYEVRMTHVQQTARISSVSSWGLWIFSLSHACDKMKNIFLQFFTMPKTYYLSYSINKNMCFAKIWFFWFPGWRDISTQEDST